MSGTVLAAIITAGGVIIAALIERVHRGVSRVESKIEGLSNGTYRQAMAAISELRREREERILRGLHPRRAVDRLVDPEPQAPPAP